MHRTKFVFAPLPTILLVKLDMIFNATLTTSITFVCSATFTTSVSIITGSAPGGHCICCGGISTEDNGHSQKTHLPEASERRPLWLPAR